MPFTHRVLLLPLLLRFAAQGFAADPPKPDPKQATTPQMAQQQAIAAMEQSLAAQKASIAKQVGQQPSGSFFLLGRPKDSVASLGAGLPDCDPLPQLELDPLITAAATRADLQPELLRSVMKQESAFRPCAVSSKGAMGLMQLMPATAAQFGVTDPFDPQQNVDAGARFLKQLLDLYKDLPTALGAYNAGPGKVNEAGGVPNIPETLGYIQRILSALPHP